MNNSFSESYKAAGVDVTAGYKAVELMKNHVARTKTSGVLSGIGGFGGLFELDLTGIEKPVLVSGTDGVGTKLKLAISLDKHDTIGIDCVAMCVNDIVCGGAKPLVFLDYIAVGKNFPEQVAQIVGGVSEGCVQAGCALVGGETAEMPGMYSEGDYDLAGFSVGVVDKAKIIDGTKVASGNKIIGLASTGAHSNGFSLIRSIFGINENPSVLNETPVELDGKTLGEVLLAPTKIYVKSVLEVNEKVGINAISHITGGGFFENIPRMLPEDKKAVIYKDSYPVPAIFGYMQKVGNIDGHDMYNTFNMGIGMMLVVDADKAEQVIEIINNMGDKAYIIGEVQDGSAKGVEIL